MKKYAFILLTTLLCSSQFASAATQGKISKTKKAGDQPCAELIFWYDSSSSLGDGFQQASMWYTPCGASRESTKVFNYDGSNASTQVALGSRVRIGIKNHAASLMDVTIAGNPAYASCSYYKDNSGYPYTEINTCQPSGPPSWGTSAPRSKKSTKNIHSK
jgi:hypothetical protein